MLVRLLKWLFQVPDVVDPPEGGSQPSSTVSRDYDLDQPAPTAPTERPAGTGQASSSLGGLDTDRFEPLSVEEALQETRSADWQTAYWDSLSVIPSAELARIKVIDSTMVGLGLISSDELAEIHDIGQQMDLYRNHGAVIERAAATAVNESRRAKQQRREQKKLEAEERRRIYKEAVAHRKATDIVYLGRGVSRGLADRRSNIEKLQANELPVLSSPADVATAMDLAIPKLRWLAWHSEAPTRVHYYYFKVPKKSGGQRQLSAPHRQLEDAQRWILDHILDVLPAHDAAHGFVTGRSVVSNARPHVQSMVVVNTDLEDFFPSITFARVDGLFRSMGYSPAVATILALLCTECPRRPMQYGDTTYYAATGERGLPQGACTSPAISNLICRRLDHRMSSMAAMLNWNYTRYADDITWSAREEATPSIGYVMARIRHISEDEGFRINEKKTRILRPSQRQSVTGVVVNDRLSVPRKTIRRVRAILHNAKRTGLEAQNRDGHPNFECWLQGMIAWISMVNPDQGRRLDNQFQELMP